MEGGYKVEQSKAEKRELIALIESMQEETLIRYLLGFTRDMLKYWKERSQ